MRNVPSLCLLAIGMIVLTPFLASAEEATTLPPAPEQVKKLYPYSGGFKGTGTMTMATKANTIQVHHVNTIISGGYGMEFLEDITSPGEPDYHAVHLLGYDPSTKLVHLFTIDSNGNVRDHKGGWKGNTLNLRYDGIVGGKAFVEELSCTLNGPNEYTISGKSTLGGDQYEAFQATLQRVSTPTMPGK